MPRWKKLLGSAALSAVPMGALLWLADALTSVVQAISQLPPVVEFSNGFGYALGAVIGLGPMAAVSLYGAIHSRLAPARYQRVAFQALIVGAALMLAGNPIATFLLDRYFLTAGYQACEPLSSRWLNHRSIVYTRPASGECEVEAAVPEKKDDIGHASVSTC